MPIALGGAILWWMYRGFDFARFEDTLLHEMNWGWMIFSLVFGITAQVFRGLRWTQTLEPLGEHPSKADCIHAVFISYAASLIVPRLGEVTRCGVLKKYDNTNFSRSLGTVVTERVIDSLLILAIVATVCCMQLSVFRRFFDRTGTNLAQWTGTFTTTGWIVTILCLIVTVVFLCIAIRRFQFLANVRKAACDLKEGVLSLRNVRNKWLFAAYTIGIWLSYFLHFYITFFCFDFTAGLGLMTALVAFIVGSIAVVVPTPNGLGPWHFAVKTILVLYGTDQVGAETFVLIVHTLQTALIPLLGIYSLMALTLRKDTNDTDAEEKTESTKKNTAEA